MPARFWEKELAAEFCDVCGKPNKNFEVSLGKHGENTGKLLTEIQFGCSTGKCGHYGFMEHQYIYPKLNWWKKIWYMRDPITWGGICAHCGKNRRYKPAYDYLYWADADC